MSDVGWVKATPLCEHRGHRPGEWFYSCCACSGAPGGCAHCETDWDGVLLFPDGVIPNDHDAHADACACRTCAGVETVNDRPKWVDLFGIDPTYGDDPIEAVVVDDSNRYDRICQGMVETMTEFDWEGDGPLSVPEHLRERLRQWCGDLLDPTRGRA